MIVIVRVELCGWWILGRFGFSYWSWQITNLDWSEKFQILKHQLQNPTTRVSEIFRRVFSQITGHHSMAVWQLL